MSTRPGTDLTTLANVGPAVARRLVGVGVQQVADLRGRDPLDLYREVEAQVGHPEDPCLLDTLMSAVDQAGGGEARPWWSYTAERKRLLAEATDGYR